MKLARISFFHREGALPKIQKLYHEKNAIRYVICINLDICEESVNIAHYRQKTYKFFSLFSKQENRGRVRFRPAWRL